MGKKVPPFKGTKEQAEKLASIIEKNKGKEGVVISVMHDAQEIYGYLPIEVQTMIAEGLGVPLSEIYGIATFYSRFSLSPKGECQIGVCLGTACYVKGSNLILDKIKEVLGIDVGECTPDGKFSIDATRCIGACGLAPVITINDDVYGKLTVDQVEDILKKYQEGGQSK